MAKSDQNTENEEAVPVGVTPDARRDAAAEQTAVTEQDRRAAANRGKPGYGAPASVLDEAHARTLAEKYPDVPSRQAAIGRALAEGGALPASIEHIGPAEPEHETVLQDFTPQDKPAPRATWGQSSTYLIPERDIFASSVGRRVTSYTFDATTVSADANGDKIVMEGTVCALSGTKLRARTNQTAVGVLSRRINVRNGDKDVGLVVSGALRLDKLWDNGVFGTVDAGAQTDLAAKGIVFFPYDI